MTVTDKYWWHINKKSYISTFVFVFLFTVVLRSSMTGLGVFFAIITIISCATRFLNLNAPIYNETDSLNQLLIMPFSREQIYKSFIKNMLIQALITVTLVFIGDLLETTFLYDHTASTMIGDIQLYTRYYMWFDFFKVISIILLILIFIIGLISNFTSRQKSFIIFAIIAISGFSIFGEIFIAEIINMKKYLLLSTVNLQIIMMTINVIICAVLVIVLIRQIKTNYNQFVLHKYMKPSYWKLKVNGDI